MKVNEDYVCAVEHVLRREECTFSAAVRKIATMLSDKDKEIEELKSQIVVLKRTVDMYHEPEYL